MGDNPGESSVGDGIGLVIDGEVVAGEAGSYPVTNPVRPAEVVLDAPSASLAQLDKAMAAARRASPAWAALAPAERAELVAKAAAAAGAVVGSSDLARLLTREHGKVLWEAQFDAGTIGGMAGAFAPLVAEALETRSLKGGGGRHTSVEYVPFGVVACVLPFNWPVSVLGNKILPALLTGNTVVVKAPPTCPGAVLAVTAAMAEALPPGVVNAVNGPGPELGAALVAHPHVDMVSFTGGVPTGRAVMAGASAGLTPVVLELGGNDPALIAPDVEIDEALAAKIVEAAFITSGQVCMAIKRLYVPEEKVALMVDALVARLSQEVVGDGLADEVTMGPVHRPAARDRVEAMLAQAQAAGARVHRPGRLRDDDAGAGGYLVSPAIVEGASDHDSIVCDEQFAPALPVLGYRRLEEALERANHTVFGLCASIWTADDAVADDMAGRLQAGTVFVNAHGTSAMDHRAPFGGWKQSGYGVELGPEGMRAFTRPRTVLRFPAPS
ncbi:MAG TPA: aldehyde dehydrogenase family protein [Acidimicrobiales bacterium]|nr:aldehyde dehydrogenase family protein [Acidimicrobiales bacterium]